MAADPTFIRTLLYRVRPTGLGLADGAAVASLPFSVGGLTAAQATSGARPTFLASGAGGQPAVRFDGTDDQLVTGAIPSGRGQPITVCLVLRTDNVATMRNVCQLAQIEVAVDDAEVLNSYAEFTFLTGGALSTSTASVATILFNGGSSQQWVNGTSAATGHPGDGFFFSGQSFYLGGHATLTARAFSGDIYELLAFGRVLSTSERNYLHSYVQSTYGITVAGGTPAPVSAGTNITSLGVPIAKVTTPTGGGNTDLEVIRDGVTPAVGSSDASTQYDSFHGGGVETEDWYGYMFPADYAFTQITFQEGNLYGDGGYFTSLVAQVRQNGTWTTVPGQTCTPTYSGNNASSFDTYVFTFPASTGDGIRVHGPPGGTAYFTSIAELQVLGGDPVTTPLRIPIQTIRVP